MRTLYYVPVIHTPSEVTVSEDIEKHLTFTLLQWQKFAVRYWKAVRSLLLTRLSADKLLPKGGLLLKKIPIYVDSLSVGRLHWPTYLKHVPYELGSSPMHQLISYLYQRGAEVEGIEDTVLLNEFFEYHKSSNDSAQKYFDKVSEMADKRDRYIGPAISNDLQEGEVGILFMGILHNVHKYLDPSIQVRFIGKSSVLPEEFKKRLLEFDPSL